MNDLHLRFIGLDDDGDLIYEIYYCHDAKTQHRPLGVVHLPSMVNEARRVRIQALMSKRNSGLSA